MRDHGNRVFHSFVGCPPALFFRISSVLHAAKAYRAGSLSQDAFQPILDKARNFFHYWDPQQATYPTAAPEWYLLAEAFRHACMLRVLRFPNAFTVPCTNPAIQASASAIMDVCAKMPRGSVYYKRLLFPLFLAGAELASPHQIQYVGWLVDEIKRSTGFQYPAMTDMLSQVWEERQHHDNDQTNIPWMEFVSITARHNCLLSLTLRLPRLVQKCFNHSTPTSSSDGRCVQKVYKVTPPNGSCSWPSSCILLGPEIPYEVQAKARPILIRSSIKVKQVFFSWAYRKMQTSRISHSQSFCELHGTRRWHNSVTRTVYDPERRERSDLRFLSMSIRDRHGISEQTSSITSSGYKHLFVPKNLP